MIDEYSKLKKGKLLRIYNYFIELQKNKLYQFNKTYLSNIKHLFE